MTLWLHYPALKASFPPSLSLLIPSYICLHSNCYHYLQHTLPDIKAHIFYIFKLKYLISCPTYTIKNSKNGSLSRSTSILACHKCVEGNVWNNSLWKCEKWYLCPFMPGNRVINFLVALKNKLSFCCLQLAFWILHYLPFSNWPCFCLGTFNIRGFWPASFLHLAIHFYWTFRAQHIQTNSALLRPLIHTFSPQANVVSWHFKKFTILWSICFLDTSSFFSLPFLFSDNFHHG